jgi:hypothetical protein
VAIRVRIALCAALLPFLVFGAQSAMADNDGAAIEAVAPADPAGEIFPAPPPIDMALVVFGGGTTDDALTTNACMSGKPASLWTYVDGDPVHYSPEADSASRGSWDSLFGSGIPAFTPIGVDCR